MKVCVQRTGVLLRHGLTGRGKSGYHSRSGGRARKFSRGGKDKSASHADSGGHRGIRWAIEPSCGRMPPVEEDSPMRPLDALALFLFVAGPAAAQPKAGQVQPDKLDVGTIYVGATVEASFLIFEPGTDPTIAFSAEAPKFVKI